MWTANYLKQATQGQWTEIPAQPITGISIDTRTLQPGDLFIALRGEHHDGHDFIPKAWQAGVSAVVASRCNDNAKPTLVVSDTMQALNDLAHFARKRSQAKIIAVTGSVGKTTAKALLAHVLSYFDLTVASEGNLNNFIGVPLSLARLHKEAIFGVFELGTNHPGEIRPLSEMVQPHAVLITAVEKAHQAFFPTEIDILLEKMSITDGLTTQEGLVILPRDHRHFFAMLEQAKARGLENIITYGKHPDSTIHLQKARLQQGITQLEVTIAGRSYCYDWYLLGQHNQETSLAVLALAHGWGLDKKMVCKALSFFRPLEGRGQRHWASWQDGIVTLIDEAYNANPASMQAALKNLMDQPIQPQGRRLAILADMLELGSSEVEDHKVFASLLNNLNIDKIFVCGPLMKGCYDKVNPAKQSGWAKSVQDLWPMVYNNIRPNDVVLLKGSHSMNLVFILNKIINNNKK